MKQSEEMLDEIIRIQTLSERETSQSRGVPLEMIGHSWILEMLINLKKLIKLEKE